MNDKKGKQKIIDYYEYTRRFYKYMWHGSTGGIHYGFWDDDTKSHKEALLNTNKFMAELAKISKDDYVLDAGCGVGGSAIYLAKNIGCRVHGITLSPSQLNKARESTQKMGLEDKLEFTLQDYLNTNFENETFDVVWAIESVCYAEDKRDFLKEAWRILKPGGRLVISDGFLFREPKGIKEEKEYKQLLEGWAMPNLAKKDEFAQSLKELGFQDIKYVIKVKETLPEARKIYRMTLWGYPLSKITEFLGLTSPILSKNNLAGLTQYKLLKKGVWGHVVFFARKP